MTPGGTEKAQFAIGKLVFGQMPPTLVGHGGDMASTWVAKLRVHAEGQSTS